MKTRLAKFIADSGIASRREAERLIESGVVFVNGNRVDTPVFFIGSEDKVRVKDMPVRIRTGTRIFAFNKPTNTVTSARDPDGRKTIYDYLPEQLHGFKYVGRLDYKTTGLLLLTDDGDMARKLTLPESKIIRTYMAKLRPDPATAKIRGGSGRLREFLSPLSSDDSIFDPLRNGIVIDGIRYAPMEIELLTRYPLSVKISLREGKKNEIRIAFAHIGLSVSKLHRVSYGIVMLGDLPVGKFRELSKAEIKRILA
ncbi:MAG: pseudouridine synthase [Alphaproteobacteria bacterium]|nr:pseudouridine synthase [Alphaproteobacteria bacterium]